MSTTGGQDLPHSQTAYESVSKRFSMWIWVRVRGYYCKNTSPFFWELNVSSSDPGQVLGFPSSWASWETLAFMGGSPAPSQLVTQENPFPKRDVVDDALGHAANFMGKNPIEFIP